MIAVAVQKNGEVWQYNQFDGNGWIDCPDQTQYDPPFQVRALNIMDVLNANQVIEYDSAGRGDWQSYPSPAAFQTGIIERLATNVRHSEWLTKIYLNSSSTAATSIIFHG